ncbi:hypothetical protein ScPMuIL_009478 [Solemya velum]
MNTTVADSSSVISQRVSMSSLLFSSVCCTSDVRYATKCDSKSRRRYENGCRIGLNGSADRTDGLCSSFSAIPEQAACLQYVGVTFRLVQDGDSL